MSRPRTVTTGRVPRRELRPSSTELDARTRFHSRIQPIPAVRTVDPRPFGDLSAAPADTLLTITQSAWKTAEITSKQRVDGTRFLLDHLAAFPGDTWQQRWIAAGLDDGKPARDLGRTRYEQAQATAGARSLFCLRVIQPSLTGFRANRFNRYPVLFQAVQADALLDAFFAAVAAADMRPQHKLTAMFDVCCLLTVQGLALADLTPAALLYYVTEGRRQGLTLHAAGDRWRLGGIPAWNVLHGMGHFAADTPATLRAAMLPGKKTPAELVGPVPDPACRRPRAPDRLRHPPPGRGRLQPGRQHRPQPGQALLVRDRAAQPHPDRPAHRPGTVRALLQLAQAAAPGAAFTFDGRTYRRHITRHDLRADKHDEVPVRIAEEATGEVRNVGREEEDAFWDWAIVETLRHSGVRIEELCELTHLSVRQYRRPGGEVVALLVIAPSKTDRERVIPMSAELFHSIAAIIRRHTRNRRMIPLVSRWDPYDKTWSTRLPFLSSANTAPLPG